MLTVSTVLHPTDFSSCSQAAFRLACALARDYGARLVVLHVTMPPPLYHGEGALPPVLNPSHENLRARLEAIQPKEIDLPIEHVLREGDAADVILHVADEVKADMIVLGTHGRSGLSRLIVGSVAEHVLRGATCPVVTVKEPPAAPASEPVKQPSLGEDFMPPP